MVLFVLLGWLIGFNFLNEHESDHHRAEGERLYDQEKYDESLYHYQKAFELIREKDKIRAANLCNDMSSVYYALQMPDSSIVKCYEGLALLSKIDQESKPDSIYFKLYSSLGTMYHALARTDSSTYYFLLSDQLIEDNTELADQIPEYVLHHYLNQGISVWRKHRYYDSITYFEKAMGLARRKKMTSELGYIYSNLAEVYSLLNQHEKALKMRMLAIQQIPSSRQQSLQAAYTGIGRIYGALNQADSSLYWYNKSLRILSQITQNQARYHGEFLFLMIEKSNLYLQKGDITSARDRIRKAHEHYIKNQIDNPLLLSNIYLTSGEIEKKIGNWEDAMRHYRTAYSTLMPEVKDGDDKLPDNIQHPLHAIRIVQAQIGLFEQRYERNKNFTDLEAAFLLYDRLIAIKKKSYRQVVVNDNDRYFYIANNQSMMDRAILNAYAYFEKTGSLEAVETLFHRLEDANTTHLMDIISGNYSEESAKNTSWESNLKEIQRKLDSKTAFLSYRQIDNVLIGLVVKNNFVDVKKWTLSSEAFYADLRNLMLEVKQNPGLGSYTGSPMAQKCYQVLMHPIEPWLKGISRLVIARDWKFASLPFEVLEERQDHYLADRYSISYTYSASFFWEHPGLSRPRPKSYDAYVFAPFVNHAGNEFSGWKPISSMSEVRSMGQDYVYGEDATKHHFIQTAPQHYILNLATHAFADLKNPGSSYVQFYPGVDSKLYLDEVMALNLSGTRLVMLSSCFGNEGVEYAGEGVISLAYAFARAGSPSLLTTSWEANENTTGFLTRTISSYLEQGLPLDEALQKARQALRSHRSYQKYNHPYFWANLSLLGNHSPVYEPQSSIVKYGYTTALVLLTIVMILWGRKKKDVSMRQ